MARLARVVAGVVPLHVTQRGNRRQEVFFSDDDYVLYRALVAEHCASAKVEIWAYCLMPNHVHLIAVPRVHMRAARRGWTLWLEHCMQNITASADTLPSGVPQRRRSWQ